MILGGGVTGLAAGYASGLPVYEAEAVPGGICSSYYVRPGTAGRLYEAPGDGEAYRFEIGGGHWIFGGDPAVLRFIGRQTPVRAYRRRAAVYFAGQGLYVPYPLQYHLGYLGEELATRALAEMLAPAPGPCATMAEWLEAHFGPTLLERFFGPFHARYTAGLWTEIAPQDAYKTPVDPALARQGARGETPAAGYNVSFVYPEAGLDALARGIAGRADVRYGRRAVAVDPARKTVAFAGGDEWPYDVLVSTVPLRAMAVLCGLETGVPPDPYTSVLVLNLGAVRGAACPGDHWLYVPDSRAGFFRLGCYSNVDAAFLPASARGRGDRVGLYVERAYPGGARPAEEEVARYTQAVVEELQAWGFIEAVDAADPTWIDVAYTWSRPGSAWRAEALKALEAYDILMVGRYGRWTFQGIADSIRDGFVVGTAFRNA
jgi:protoporphyrinogen oxidase